MTTTAGRRAMTTATVADTVRATTMIALPTILCGAVKRRHWVMRIAQRYQWDRRSITAMRQLAERYGPSPVRLRIPGRTVALVLNADDVQRLLVESPEPFTPASREKRAALSTFQPHGVLISHGEERRRRRQFTESVLDTGMPVHRLAAPIVVRAKEEYASLAVDVARGAVLDWPTFERAWWRLVRRIVLGDSAREDETLITLLESLRRSGNWAYLGRRRTLTRQRFAERLRSHLERAEPDSLAELIASTTTPTRTCPSHQVPHWLFAFDAAAMAAFRALGLLATHPDRFQVARARLDREGLGTNEHPYLAASVLESLRLWPTTPMILRDTTASTLWGGVSVPSGASFVVFTPYFHRDERSLPHADGFEPEAWLTAEADEPGVVPFSAGPAACPGRELVLFVASAVLAELLRRNDYRLDSDGPLRPGALIPATLDPFTMRFALASDG
ncbi:cytochrome P450 [Stackebrandtia soli]|uniref:cytochrome P450 n=1 Tax=Stackebrandtia soli TaxID=1892856 RepID=UPI0039E9CCAF